MAYLIAFYFLFLIAYLVYSAIGIYHLWRFGYVGDLTRPVVVIYSLVSIFIILSSLVLLFSQPWPDKMQIF